MHWLASVVVVSSIVDGKPSPDAQDATVLLTTADQSCSGSLIAPNLVMTARHCVSNLGEDSGCVGNVTSNLPPSSINVSVGAALTADHPDPVARGSKLYVPSSTDTCGNDIAFIQLDQDVDAPIAKLRFTKPTANESVMVVGYGVDGGMQNLTPSRYQRTDMKVLAVGPANFTYTQKTGHAEAIDVVSGEIATSEGACHGDSGGPLMDAKGNVIGVVSRGALAADVCKDNADIFTALWSQEQRIRDILAAVGHPLPAASPTPPPTTDAPSDDASDSFPATHSAQESDDDDAPPIKKKSKPQIQSSGCTLAHHESSSTAWLLVAGAAVALFHRRSEDRKIFRGGVQKRRSKTGQSRDDASVNDP